MRHSVLAPPQALATVRQARWCINPQIGLVEQLSTWEDLLKLRHRPAVDKQKKGAALVQLPPINQPSSQW